MKESFLLEVIAQLFKAMVELRKLNIAHRDLKPDNILLRKYGNKPNEFIITIGDFGLSKYS